MKVVTAAIAIITLAGLASAQSVIRISSGGAGAITDSLGRQWLSDRYFTGGDIGYTSDPIKGTPDSRLYATTRNGLYGNFEYNVPAANGSYNLTLKFAETLYWNKGARVFNVIVNGYPVLTNFDILNEVPARTALDKTFPITVTNGTVRIQFNGVVHLGIVSAIELQPTPSATEISISPSSVALTAGQSVQFTATVNMKALAVSAAGLNFVGPAYGVNPGSQTINITDEQGGALTWAAASSQSWMKVAALSTVDGSNLRQAVVSVDTKNMPAGTYTGVITVAAPGAAGSPRFINVTLALK